MLTCAGVGLLEPFATEGNELEEGIDCPQWVEVAIDRPSHLNSYTYRLPPALGDVRPGDILAVPFGSQVVAAIATSLLQELPHELNAAKVKPVEDVMATGLIPPHLQRLLEQVSDYYIAPLAQVVRTVLPPGILARAQRRICLQGDLQQFLPADLSSPARALLELLDNSRGDLSWRFLRQRVQDASQGLRELQRKKLVNSYFKHGKTVAPKTQQVVTLCNGDAETTARLTARQSEVLAILKRIRGQWRVRWAIAVSPASRSPPTLFFPTP